MPKIAIKLSFSGQFVDVLAGVASGNFIIDAADLAECAAALGMSGGDAFDSVTLDGDGNGTLSESDARIVQAAYVASLG